MTDAQFRAQCVAVWVARRACPGGKCISTYHPMMLSRIKCYHFEGECMWSGLALQGEGEVKLIQRLVKPFDGSNSTDSYAIIGSDSDLFIMAMLQESSPNLWIMPEGEVSPGSGSSMEGFNTLPLAAKWGEQSSKAAKVGLCSQMSTLRHAVQVRFTLLIAI